MKINYLGITEYGEALSIQKHFLEKRIKKEIPDTLIMTEHEEAVTLGRTSDLSSIVDKDFFRARNIPVLSPGRGGKVTYHSPGQLVLYPIINLKDAGKDICGYIDLLENIAVRVLVSFGLPAEKLASIRGVWVAGKKIAFTGIAVKKWVTFHGMVVNINNDIGPFSRIHPCGEKEIKVTSALKVLGCRLDMEKVRNKFAEEFEKVFER